MSSKVQTKENDYLAADGLWYPSNKLEGYLKKPKPNAYADMTGLTGILKELYSDKIHDLFGHDNALISTFPKDDSDK